MPLSRAGSRGASQAVIVQATAADAVRGVGYDTQIIRCMIRCFHVVLLSCESRFLSASSDSMPESRRLRTASSAHYCQAFAFEIIAILLLRLSRFCF
jgi:hypothetical protein